MFLSFSLEKLVFKENKLYSNVGSQGIFRPSRGTLAPSESSALPFKASGGVITVRRNSNGWLVVAVDIIDNDIDSIAPIGVLWRALGVALRRRRLPRAYSWIRVRLRRQQRERR